MAVLIAVYKKERKKKREKKNEKLFRTRWCGGEWRKSKLPFVCAQRLRGNEFWWKDNEVQTCWTSTAGPGNTSDARVSRWKSVAMFSLAAMSHLPKCTPSHHLPGPHHSLLPAPRMRTATPEEGRAGEGNSKLFSGPRCENFARRRGRVAFVRSPLHFRWPPDAHRHHAAWPLTSVCSWPRALRRCNTSQLAEGERERSATPTGGCDALVVLMLFWAEKREVKNELNLSRSFFTIF